MLACIELVEFTEAGILLAHKDNRVESPQFVGWNCLNPSTARCDEVDRNS